MTHETKIIRYKHRLSQISSEIRDIVDSMANLAVDIGFAIKDGGDQVELSNKYTAFLVEHDTRDAIARLNKLVRQMKTDEALQDRDDIIQDIKACNEYVLQLCRIQISIISLLHSNR